MKTQIRNFFGITANTYEYEPMDLFTILTILNVTLVLLGVHWAPIIGIVNCVCSLANCIKNHCHINNYIMQIALIVLNGYFLTL